MKSYMFIFISLLFIGACTQRVAVDPAYNSHVERFLENVRIKSKDDSSITYEYKDIRIDEIAYFAAEYCYEQNHKKAVLRKSLLYRNFSRRATFDCI